VVASLKIVVALNFENPTKQLGRQEQEYHSIWPAIVPNVPASLFNIWRQTGSVAIGVGCEIIRHDINQRLDRIYESIYSIDYKMNHLAEGFRNSLRYSLQGLTTRGLATNHTVPADVKPAGRC